MLAQSRGVAHRYELHTGVPVESASQIAEVRPRGAKSSWRGRSASGVSARSVSTPHRMLVEPLEYCW